MNLLLHDDWEINGDGTGDPEVLMFEPARKLLDICDRYVARYTFFAEVMQQLAMLESPVKQHREWAAAWERILTDAVRRGHDVQLHLHPQWVGAEFNQGRWQLDFSKWNLATLSEDEIHDLISRGKEYLEELLIPVRASYRVVALRVGGWMAQPSGNLIRAMRRANILADCSVVPGKHRVFRDHGSIDYRMVPSRLLPWWTTAENVAEAGAPDEGVIELPTYAESYRAPLPIHLLRRNPSALSHYLRIYRRKRRRDRAHEFTPPLDRAAASARSTYCSFGYIHYRTLLKMARAAQGRARDLLVPEAPLVMLTHSKSFFSFSNFERFLRRAMLEQGFTFSRTRDYVLRLASGEVPCLPLSTKGLGAEKLEMSEKLVAR